MLFRFGASKVQNPNLHPNKDVLYNLGTISGFFIDDYVCGVSSVWLVLPNNSYKAWEWLPVVLPRFHILNLPLALNNILYEEIIMFLKVTTFILFMPVVQVASYCIEILRHRLISTFLLTTFTHTGSDVHPFPCLQYEVNFSVLTEKQPHISKSPNAASGIKFWNLYLESL